MKRLVGLMLALLLVGCSAVAPSPSVPSRSDLSAQLEKVAALEEKQSEMQMGLMMMGMMGMELGEEKEKALKQHSDLLYIYTIAMYSALGTGDIPTFEKLLQAANAELDAVEKVIQSVVEVPPVEVDPTATKI